MFRRDEQRLELEKRLVGESLFVFTLLDRARYLLKLYRLPYHMQANRLSLRMNW